MGDHRKLEVWQRARKLTREVYLITRSFPAEERFEIVRQLRKAASSIPANLAEGCGRKRDGELRRFVGIALGSAEELDTHFLVAMDAELGELDTLQRLQQDLGTIRRMLAKLADRLK